MIQLQEVRIGNWILPNSEEIWIPEYNKVPVKIDVDIINSHILEGYDQHYYYIELTPKLLERFGWKFEEIKNPNIHQKQKLNHNVLGFNFYQIEIKWDKCNFKLFIKHKGANEYYPVYNIKYLHQLQNLFYSLTGIELNDIVAYNYYLGKGLEFYTEFKGMTFNQFLENDKKGEVWFEYPNLPSYSLGDLPPNLFL